MIPSQPVIPMLNYAAPARVATARRPSAVQVALFVLALPALVTPFVRFTFGTSPLDVIADHPSHFSELPLYLCAVTFFAAFPIMLRKGWRLFFPAPPARWTMPAIAVVSLIVNVPAIVIASLMVAQTPGMIRDDTFQRDEAGMLALILATLVGGSVLALWRWRRRSLIAGVDSFLVVGYLTVMAICLLAFHDDPEVGYWLSVPVAASFAAEMLLPHRANL